MTPMNPLIQQLEAAVLRRNPPLAERLYPGLPIETIKKELKKAGIAGAIEPILELYSWRNGSDMQGEGLADEAGFTPPIVIPLSESTKQYLRSKGNQREANYRSYKFIYLKYAIIIFKEFKISAKYNPWAAVLVGRYFPILWDGSTEYVAVDIYPPARNRVVTIQTGRLREAYDSFEDFLKDAIRANETNELLACMRTPGRPIVEPPLSQLEPSTTGVASAAGKIPETENSLVLRTDFSDEKAWKSLCKKLQDPDDEMSPELDFVSDRAFENLTAAKVPTLLSEDSTQTFAFIVDHTALTSSGHPVLVIDLHDQRGRTFRVTAAALGGVANNLSIANMDFEDFAKAVDKEGIFHGF